MMDEWKAQINSFNFPDRKFPCANRHGPIKRHRDQEDYHRRGITMKAPKPFDIFKGGTVPLLVAFVGFAGGVIGSLVGPYLTAQHQTAKDITDRRVAVYQKFFAAQAKLLQSTSPNSTKEEKDKLTKDYQQETKEARFEIGVFASAEVIQALVNWFETKDRTDQKDLWKEDAKIYQAMRKEIFGTRGKVDDADLYNLLFKY